MTIIKKVVGLPILLVSLFFGVYAIALGQAIGGLIASFINAYPNKKLLNYSYIEQWNDIIPSLLLSLVMGAVVYGIQLLEMKVWMTLIIQVCVGAFLYVGMAWVFKLECFNYLISIVRDIFISRKGKTV